MNLTGMNESHPFDLVRSPLAGANLIEASAGTGKTYAITAIFLRLLLEQQIKVSQILVVTYTVAATEELRDRIRRQIRAVIVAMENGTTEDEFIGGLIRGLAHPEEGLRLLKAALRNFDEAPIFTIHSFCQQVLREHAFESLSLFDTELITDERPLTEEIVEDFWRRNFYEAVPEFIRYAREKKYGPEAFLKITRNSISPPDVRIQPEIQPIELHSLELFRNTLRKVKAAWGTARSEVIGKLKDPGLNKTSYKNPDVLISLMDLWMNREVGLPFFPGWEKFTPVVLKQKTNKNQQTPGHPFFDLCGELWDIAQTLQREMDHQLLYLKTEIFRVLRRELPIKKEQQNVQSYDDLLIRVRTALEKPGGEALAQTLRQRYHAALIDEFQDTDPVQYAIFQTVFGKGSILFLIGDPKQAIYSFRSADLFSYLRASRQVQNRYSLTHNWRSEPRLVAAVNHVFAAPVRKESETCDALTSSSLGQYNHKPFVFVEIPFHTASGVDDPDRPLLKLSGDANAPFQLVYFDKESLAGANAAGNKENFRRLIAGAVAGEISRLLSLARQGRANIGAAPLQPGDMAVLVRENREARLVQEALHELAIPSVLHSAGNIFDSPEALEMERLLAGVAEPRSEKALGTALVTDIMGVSGETLMFAKREERPWEVWVNRFQQYNDLWEEAGFIRMFRTILRNEDVHPRLMGYRDGERRLTNLLHLSEILHNEASARKLGMAGLIKWLARQRDPDATRLEEHELRLESDANAVRLVTIYKSKGLEYPLVFCPFQWGSSRTRKDELPRYHDEQDDWRLNLILADEDQQAGIMAERESLAENIRLLYVALTRAKYRAYLYWGPFKDAGSSAVAYTLHPVPSAPSPSPLTFRDIVAEAETHFSSLTEDQIRADLADLVERSGGTIQLIPFAAEPGIPYQRPPETAIPLAGRTFTGQIPRADRIASFSYFVAHKEKEEDLDNADRDQAPPTGESTPAGILAPPAPSPGFMSPPGLTDAHALTSIFAFPAGKRAGIFIHDIFEALDFTDDSAIEAVVGKKLSEHGYEPYWQDTLCTMIRKVLAAPLAPSVPGLQLSAVSPASCLRELGFYFPLQPVTPEKLSRLFSGKGIPEHYPRQMGRLNFMPAQGFMNGYMDLVFRFAERFYLIDWKSNLLGTNIDNYGQDALTHVMEEDYYLLQYHLYVLALDQYLKSRLGAAYDYKRHFGGVFYLFLRGVDPARGGDFGIYRDRPTPETIATLARGLIKTE